MILTPRKKPSRPMPGIDRPWTKIASYRTSGQRTFLIEVGNPVRVEGLPGGSTGDYCVISIEQHRDDGRINVEVKRRGDHRSRVVPASRIKYVRPKS